jgi:hydrogenase maturation protein HypF
LNGKGAKSVLKRFKVRVTGVVQGVGFRPFVFRLASELGLSGYVMNASGSVEIEVEGEEQKLHLFTERLRSEAPPLSKIASMEVYEVEPLLESGFRIVSSEATLHPRPVIPPDVALCSECLRELSDPKDRRFLYPFINCTNCGPRFTIIFRLPYDRPNTTMARFKMCELCEHEYHDPANRRFHAQPNACPSCGPKVWLSDGEGKAICSEGEESIRLAGELLAKGYIIGIKGLGGFHIACDARNEEAVRKLRMRKRRPAKPFAIMCRDEHELTKVVKAEGWEMNLLRSLQSPIVLLPQKEGSGIAPNVAPNNLYQGVMLPYTPLHVVLMRYSPSVLVMTSGNVSDEPICFRNEEALKRLSGIVDFFLLHDRDIHIPCDDSVVRPMAGEPVVIRRSRGYVPTSFELPKNLPAPALAVGADLKNTFCIAQDDWAVLSQHIGDVENFETCEYMRYAINHLCNLLGVEPAVSICDMHPRYHTTQLAKESCEISFPVQHHYAHVLSCMAENGVYEPVIGVAFDGTGYGIDGTIWGGEILLCEPSRFRRLGHLTRMPLAGGEAAIRKPIRLAFAYAWEMLGEKVFTLDGLKGLLERLSSDERRIIPLQVSRRLNSPMNTSMGRLFDAVSALLGICDVSTYEGQPAVELEMAATVAWGADIEPLRFNMYWEKGSIVLDYRPTLLQLIELLSFGEDKRHLAARFHMTVIEMVVSACRELRSLTGVNKVVLTGGVFQNKLLLEGSIGKLERLGFEVLWHRQVPPNDGGIALGQMVAFALAEAKLLTRATMSKHIQASSASEVKSA